MEQQNEQITALAVDDLGRSGLKPEDVSGLKIVGLEAMKPLPGQVDSDDDTSTDDGYDPDGYDEDEETETADPSEGFEAVGGYTIPYYTLYGKPIREGDRKFQRVRLVGRKNTSVPRYRSPKGSQNHVYIPQGLRDLLVRLDRQNAIVPEVHILRILEGEKKAVRGVKAGIPCIALPGVSMWADSAKVRAMKTDYAKLGGDPKDVRMTESTPVNPELLQAIAEIKALCPSIGIVSVLYDSDGLPVSEKDAFRKTKAGVEPVGGVNWEACDKPGASVLSYVSANAQVTRAGYLLADALRKQCPTRVITTTQFCEWNKTDESNWEKQGLDDWLQAERYAGEVNKRLRGAVERAVRLWEVVKDEPLFSTTADPDMLGVKGGPSAEIAYSRMLDKNVVGQADGLLYEWASSHWQVVETRRAENAAHKLIDAFYADGGTARKIGDAPKAAVSAPQLYSIPVTRRWTEVGGAIIPCADVTLDITPDGTVTARDPSKDDGLRYCVNARWADKDKPSPEFDKFIRGVLPDDGVRRLVQQYIGYTLISDTRFQVAQWWFGSGANGKGFLAGIVAALHRKVAAADIEDLGGFGAENLIDASLITVDETPKRIDEQRLKSAISGDDLNINRKYHVPITTRLRAKWLLRGNDKPSLSDQTEGIWRRLQIVAFEQVFEGDDRDDMLADRIVENELPGVLRWAVEGLVMLLQAGGFKDIPESVQGAKADMQAETDNVLGWWMAREVQVCDAPRTSKDVAYRNYAAWCKDNGMMPLGAPRFWVRVGAIVKRGGWVLAESQVREQINDPISGTTETVRTRKVNLDIDGQQWGEGATADVVQMVPKGAGRHADPEPTDTQQDSGGFADLDDAEMDLSNIPF
ncbi:phage/plasmid primase, P4 family [Acidithiobacillus ferriphilus]|uniref:phage/plasmid primase, P4 family n=1 Tax=Acidithiobacillus ferriphilus TaxID=1689834 RepID=UPI001C06A938|nr:phage/plasmid primase, P4 family [Acidithiobacillus ferriphilus]MBU2831895.1 DUF3854 domain-containing protein [Acidithiobacillus ferriphilus]